MTDHERADTNQNGLRGATLDDGWRAGHEPV